MFQACENGKPLKSQSVADMNKCAVKSSVNENIDGCKWHHPLGVNGADQVFYRAKLAAWSGYGAYVSGLLGLTGGKRRTCCSISVILFPLCKLVNNHTVASVIQRWAPITCPEDIQGAVRRALYKTASESS
jgi:hypothetical protein